MNNPLKSVFDVLGGVAGMLLTQAGRDAGLEQPAETTPQAPKENLADRLVRFAAPSLTADN